MRILAINASHRGDQGHTRLLIDRLFQGAREAGAECEVVSLAKIKINRCLACNQCQTIEHHLQCVYEGQDGVRAVFDKMVRADLIIYATPVYVFGMSGLLKTFLDRVHSTSDSQELRVSESGFLFHHINRAICSKPFVTLICCDNLEVEIPRNVLAYFRTFSKFMEAPRVGVLVRNGGKLSGYGREVDAQARLFPKLPEIYATYEQAGRELAQDGFIHRATERRANQEIIPLPFFSLLKRLPFKSIKRKFVERAKKLRSI